MIGAITAHSDSPIFHKSSVVSFPPGSLALPGDFATAAAFPRLFIAGKTAHTTNKNYTTAGKPTMVEWNNGTTTQKFAYIHNLQGDVIAIIDSTGTKVVSYTYDAWGKPLFTTGPLAATLGKLTPFRYRGYVYDEETRLYYLRSRYYHPNRGRFINGDTLIVPSSLFAYGKNSPVNSIDFNGKDAIWINSSEWVRSADIPLRHTSLVIEYEGKWYYTMYAKDRIYHEVVPKSKMTDLETFSKQVRTGENLSYDSATYIWGDFSAAFKYFDALSKQYPGGDPGYNIFIKNCSTVSWDMLCMGTTPKGVSMEYLFAASRVVLGVGNKTPIPNLNNETIKMVFANSSFTANEAKAEIIKYRDKAASLLSGPLGWLYHKDLVNYFNKLLGE